VDPSTSSAPAPPASGVSILIVNWNGGAGTLRCAKAAVASGAEVVLVDNASTDGSADGVAARVPAVRLLRQRTNLGFAAGVNLAARAAHGRWLLLLNPDTIPTPAAVTRLRDTAAETEGGAAVGARLVGADGRSQAGFLVRRFPSLLTWASDLLLLDDLWPGNPVRRRYLALDVPLDGPAPVGVDQPAGACLLVPREVFERLGGLDEQFFPAWFEDVDFCRRLHDAGVPVLYEARAQITHIGGVSLASLDRAEFRRFWYRNLRRYARKHHGFMTNAVLRALLVTGMLLRIAVSTLTWDRPSLRTWAAVLRDALRQGA
jgi:GT2 family glycosyltransferase